MRLRLLPSRYFCLIGFVPALLSGGCSRDNGGSTGPLGFPPKDNVRVLSRLIEQTPDRIHWKWSLIGDRNWLRPDAEGTGLTLQGTYPINDTTRLHGSFTWECDLVAERPHDAPRTLRWTTTLHGSNGMTARSEGTLPLNGEPDRLVQIDHDRDTLERLPVDMTLARIGDSAFTLKVAP